MVLLLGKINFIFYLKELKREEQLMALTTYLDYKLYTGQNNKIRYLLFKYCSVKKKFLKKVTCVEVLSSMSPFTLYINLCIKYLPFFFFNSIINVGLFLIVITYNTR